MGKIIFITGECHDQYMEVIVRNERSWTHGDVILKDPELFWNMHTFFDGMLRIRQELDFDIVLKRQKELEDWITDQDFDIVMCSYAKRYDEEITEEKKVKTGTRKRLFGVISTDIYKTKTVTETKIIKREKIAWLVWFQNEEDATLFKLAWG